jgi:hypothetical protein
VTYALRPPGEAEAAAQPSNSPPTLERELTENLTELKALEDAHRAKIGKIDAEFKPRIDAVKLAIGRQLFELRDHHCSLLQFDQLLDSFRQTHGYARSTLYKYLKLAVAEKNAAWEDEIRRQRGQDAERKRKQRERERQASVTPSVTDTATETVEAAPAAKSPVTYVPPPPPPSAQPSAATPAAVSFMITKAQKAALAQRGYSREDIREMKPADAHEILKQPLSAITVCGDAQEDEIEEAMKALFRRLPSSAQREITEWMAAELPLDAWPPVGELAA